MNKPNLFLNIKKNPSGLDCSHVPEGINSFIMDITKVNLIDE